MNGPLRALAEDVWVAEAPQKFAGAAIGTRMTVVRLPSGTLFVHSPIRLSPELSAQLGELGPVTDVVAPNRFHHLYVADFAKAFPNARIFGAPGLAKKRPDVTFHAGLDVAPEAWGGSVEPIVLGGMPMLSEVVFVHRASRTLLLTDLCFNFAPGEVGDWTLRLYETLEGARGRFTVPRLVKLLAWNRRELRRSIARVLDADFDRITLAHGDVRETGGKDALREACAWLR